MQDLFHITTSELWEQAQSLGYYHHPSLEAEGFIHASFEDQVKGTLEKHFKGQENLILLKLNPAKISSEIKVEDKFPHIYGKLELQSVVELKKL